MNVNQPIRAVIPEELAGTRLDIVLARMFKDYSRTTLKGWILEGKVLVDSSRVRPRETVTGGEHIELWAEPDINAWQPQPMEMDIIYEDGDLIVIDKPAALVVHPGAGNQDGTLLNALLHHEPSLASLPRAGIVQRLDKDTSGIMVVARSQRAHTKLVAQLQSHKLQREYQAIVSGLLTAGGRVDAPVGRHVTQRTRMAVVSHGKRALTHYRVIRRFRAHTHIRLRLETGRTHQIRVHMAHLRHPLVGDPIYGGRVRTSPGCNSRLTTLLQEFKRQALHSSSLTLEHPATGQQLGWTAPIPHDMRALLDHLASDLEEVNDPVC